MKTYARMLVGGLTLFVLPFAVAKDLDETFKMMDADRNGKVTRAEHAAGAQEMFAKMDANRDGSVTAAEMDMKKAGKPDHAAKPDHAGTTGRPDHAGTTGKPDHAAKPDKGHEMAAAAMIKMLDQNGDGSITAAEHATGSDMMFSKMDTDGDGSLSKQECESGHKTMMKDKQS